MSPHILRRAPFALALAAALWCVSIGVYILTTFRPYGGSPLGVIPFSIPVILAALTALAARFRAPDFMAVPVALFLGFVYVTGFSIGGAFHGPAMVLALAVLVETGLFWWEKQRVAKA